MWYSLWKPGCKVIFRMMTFFPLHIKFSDEVGHQGGTRCCLSQRVKEDIKARSLRQIDNHESISTLKRSCWGRSLLLFAAYRSPDSPPQFLNDLGIHMLMFEQENTFLASDFNLPEIDWDRPSPSPGHCTRSPHLLGIMLTHNLHQVLKQPTRIQGASVSILDLVFVTQSIEAFSVSVECGLSDNDMVVFSFPINAKYARHREEKKLL